MPLTPAPVRQLPGYWEAFGHSYLMTTVGTLYQTGRMDAVLRTALDIEHVSWRNHCVTGSQLVQQGRSQGGYARVLQEVLKSQRTAPYAAQGGGVMLCWGINDIGFSGNTTQIRTAWKYALRTCISRWRATSVKEDSDASIAWGAGWTSAGGTQDFASGTTIRNATATTNANGTITLPADYAGEMIALSFVGAGGVFGGTVTFTGTASVVPALQAIQPLSVSNIMTAGTHCPVTVRVRGTAADVNKTIIMTVASVDASGGVGFDAWWLEADNPGPVIVCNVARLTTAGYAGYPTWSGSQAGADADVNNFNADLLAVVAEFGSMVQIADLDTALAKGVPPAGAPAGVTTTICPDGVHPNEYGAARCADAVIAAVRTLYPEGPLGDAAYLNTDAPLAAGMRLPRQSGQWCIPEIGAWDATAYTAVAGHMFAIPVVVTEGRERWIGLQVEQINAPATSGSSIRWAVYDDVLWSGYPCCLITELTGGGALALGTTTGMKQSPASGGGSLNQPLDPGLYWLVAKIDALGTTASQLRAINGPSPYLPAAAWVAGTPGKAMAWQLTGQSAGVLPGTFPAGAAATAGTAAGSCPCIGFKIN